MKLEVKGGGKAQIKGFGDHINSLVFSEGNSGTLEGFEQSIT